MRCVLKTSLNRTLLVRGVDANTVPRPVHPVWSGGGGGSVLKAFLLRLLPPDPLSSPVSLVTLVFCHLEVNLPLSHCSPPSCLSFLSLPWGSQACYQPSWGPQPVISTSPATSVLSLPHLPPFRAAITGYLLSLETFPAVSLPPSGARMCRTTKDPSDFPRVCMLAPIGGC